jgi:uncharacterized protein
MTPRHHALDYIEFPVDDVAKAKNFFAAAFGWTFTDYGPDYAGIVDPADPGREVGGLAKQSLSARGEGPLVQLYSDDLEATADGVTDAGGTITVPIFGFPGGRRFHFSDPSGNVLGVWSALAE